MGVVNTGLWNRRSEVFARLSHAYESRIVATLGDAPQLVFHLTQNHDISCGASRVGTPHYALDRRGEMELAQRARQILPAKHGRWDTSTMLKLDARSRLLGEITGSLWTGGTVPYTVGGPQARLAQRFPHSMSGGFHLSLVWRHPHD